MIYFNYSKGRENKSMIHVEIKNNKYIKTWIFDTFEEAKDFIIEIKKQYPNIEITKIEKRLDK